MLYDSILLRPGEIFLKGLNIGYFEQKLINNLQKIAGVKPRKKLRGRLILDFFPEHSSLKRVFGLTSYSPAVKVEKSMEAIRQKSLELLVGKKGTFKIEPKRSDKSFPLTSPEINMTLGKFIEENTSLRFEGKNPDHLLGIEINQDGAYLFTEIVPCFGGLPTGVEGRVALWVEDSASILAGLLMMKRGCDVVSICFKAKDVSLLQKFSPVKITLKVVKDFVELERFVRENKLLVLVSGQRFEQYKEYSAKLTVLRPLVAYSEGQAEEELNEFGR